ncbi:hypothetical protein H312_01174 [Anncaliia algerae PRA339]|uniref:Bromodomain associated domain-containing protein n=1 Tax=Anncaliia algerae PRA339 TaxID=1288291 RepID=A0A059F337_9MICR|nr:hypothetical protein H312_01174 [Anncaliia algerae PRA339]
MKRTIYFKIAKLAIAEILLQVGFERTNEESLNILTDVFCHFIDEKLKRIKDIQHHRYGIHRLPLPFYVMFQNVNTNSYKYKELISFLDYQIYLKNYLKEKYKVESESLLQSLKILPQKINFKSLKKDFFFNSSKELKIELAEKQEIEIDMHIMNFLEENINNTQENASKESETEMSSIDFLDEIATITNDPVILLDSEMYQKYLNSRRLSEFSPIFNSIFNNKSIVDDFLVHGEKFIKGNDDE